MSNANPFIICATVALCAGLMSACSLLPTAYNPDRPYQADAEVVVKAVVSHTSLNNRCQSIAQFIVEAGITLAMARTGNEARQADLVKKLAGSEWDARECPASAVPGLSFGTRDMAKQITNRAHKTAGLL